ncbi:hypothetical protein VN97_g2991 [Penicillium thymicola]|uniref:Uncharacterized protein n=1 Tax=Penicillium thymicola TaxID=293382 RepID=A0AAI9TPH9_PENTH|nr:hypothetical protein VN97_g2991 [Penicillium thymicola]
MRSESGKLCAESCSLANPNATDSGYDFTPSNVLYVVLKANTAKFAFPTNAPKGNSYKVTLNADPFPGSLIEEEKIVPSGTLRPEATQERLNSVSARGANIRGYGLYI